MSTAPAVCGKCGTPLQMDWVACATCGALIYREYLQYLSNQARAIESTDPTGAAGWWRQALPLLPGNSQQYQTIAEHITQLENTAALRATPGYVAPVAVLPYQDIPLGVKKPMNLAVGWLITFVSMALNIGFYAQVQLGGTVDAWQFAIGFMSLILLHEVGHMLVAWAHGIGVSPPVFVLMGAFVKLRQTPPTATVEAAIGLAGPAAGALGAVVCLVFYLITNEPLLLQLAHWTGILNLVNMLPFLPLDGGRVLAPFAPGAFRAMRQAPLPDGFFNISGGARALIAGLALMILVGLSLLIWQTHALRA